jgi:5-methylcytosine-specific restriction endonuclease McrA
MTRLRANSPRLRLDPECYQILHRSVLERDGWRCQVCGSLANLEVHHVKPRSQLGNDAEENLITLCWICHRQIHSK